MHFVEHAILIGKVRLEGEFFVFHVPFMDFALPTGAGSAR